MAFTETTVEINGTTMGLVAGLQRMLALVEQATDNVGLPHTAGGIGAAQVYDQLMAESLVYVDPEQRGEFFTVVTGYATDNVAGTEEVSASIPIANTTNVAGDQIKVARLRFGRDA